MAERRDPVRSLRVLAAETRAAAQDVGRRNERECLLRTAVGLDWAASAVEEARAEPTLCASTATGPAEEPVERRTPCPRSAL